jgi:hypothetical protein
MIKLSKKNGETFEGTPYECARKLMRDALEWEISMHGSVYARWEAEDFCATFGIDPLIIRRDLGDLRLN